MFIKKFFIIFLILILPLFSQVRARTTFAQSGAHKQILFYKYTTSPTFSAGTTNYNFCGRGNIAGASVAGCILPPGRIISFYLRVSISGPATNSLTCRILRNNSPTGIELIQLGTGQAATPSQNIDTSVIINAGDNISGTCIYSGAASAFSLYDMFIVYEF
jgi:hypothetical protein